MLNSYKTIFLFFHKFEQNCVEYSFIFSVFIMLKCVENCDPWHPTQKVPWARSEIFFYFINIHFLKKPNKKNLQQSQEIYWFFIVYLSKKMETEKWPKAVDSPLYYRPKRQRLVRHLP